MNFEQTEVGNQETIATVGWCSNQNMGSKKLNMVWWSLKSAKDYKYSA